MARHDRTLGVVGILLAQCSLTPEVAAKDLIDLELLTDARLSGVSGERSWFNDWFGKLRYGGPRDRGGQGRLKLAEASLVAKADISWGLQAVAHAKFDPEQDKPVDLVEAFLHYRPTPSSRWRYEMRAGMFFPHISRENVGLAWTSPFTITPSAINSWIGEEIRTVGVEAKATLKLEEQQVSFTGGVFGFNDPAGTLLAFRGWALGDYKVGAFSRLPLPPISSIGGEGAFLKQPLWVHPVREVDNRLGFYGAVDWRYGRRLKAGAFYYDNRGDPEVFEHKQYGWDTRFWNFYAEVQAPKGIKLIGQFLTGETEMGFLKNGVDRALDVSYAAGFLMATRKVGQHRISLRRDWFDVDDHTYVDIDNNEEVGNAWTAAFNARISKRGNLIFEFLRVNSTRPSRLELGVAPHQTQNQIQVSYRHRF